MELFSLTTPPYLPEPEQSKIVRLGLQSMNMREWLVLDEDFNQFQAHKRQMQQQHFDKVFSATPESLAAQDEFLSFLLNHLRTRHSDTFDIHDSTVTHIPSATSWSARANNLWESCLLIQEDICLMEKIDGQYCLTAASLSSPTDWKLENKIGRSIDQIHKPVPGYEEELATRVNKLLGGIKVGKPVLRYNWSIQNSRELCWRDDVRQGDETLCWRVERQTLLRMPMTGAIVFGIRIFIHSLSSMQSYEGFSDSLASIIARLPQDMKDYKGLSAS